MSILNRIFKKNKTNKRVKDIHKEKLPINKLTFIPIPPEVSDKLLQDVIDGKITQQEFNEQRDNMLPYLPMSTLSENGIVLYRMTKSSKEIAEKSIEGHIFLPHIPGKVTISTSSVHGLSMTTAENLIVCIAYGDMMTTVSFDKQKLKENNMLDEPIRKVGGMFEEYTAQKVYVQQSLPLKNPETLKVIVEMARNSTLERMLISTEKDAADVGKALRSFGLEHTLTYWEKIKDRYQELVKLNVENKIDILKEELGEILKNTNFIGNSVLNENTVVTQSNEYKNQSLETNRDDRI